MKNKKKREGKKNEAQKALVSILCFL